MDVLEYKRVHVARLRWGLATKIAKTPRTRPEDIIPGII